MYAIIQTGGKQYQVAPGDTIYVEKLNAEEGEEIVINEVLAVANDGEFKAGKPFVEGASVTVKLEKNGKQKKITVFTYKPKKNEKRKKGHRQPYSKLTVVSINA